MNEESTFGKILIIDDEKDNTEIIKDILEDVNYTTVLARSAIEAKATIAPSPASVRHWTACWKRAPISPVVSARSRSRPSTRHWTG